MDIPLPMEKLSFTSAFEKEDGNSKILTSAVPLLFWYQQEVSILQLICTCACLGLVSAEHRIQMCELACKKSSIVMVDPWEGHQSSYQGTLTILSRVQGSLCNNGMINKESLKVMLLCGSDLLQSFTIPGAWIPDQVRTICRDFGVICIGREGTNIENIIASDEILCENKSNIISVDEIVPNQISSSKVRECIRKGLSLKYLTPDEVIDYIRDHKLYLQQNNG